MNVVLYSNPAPPRPVDAGLDRYNRAVSERRFHRFREPGCLVHLEAEPVSEAVSERFPIAAFLNVAPSERVGILTGHTRSDAAGGLGVRPPDYLVNLAL